VRYRIEQLAAACDVSVDTIRYYQSRGLVPAPEREGRVAWYGDRHAERIRRVRALRRKGLTLAGIEDELLPLDEFASRSGVPASLIQAVEREGIKLGRTVDGEERYTVSDIEMVRGALRLLDYGLPLADLLALARDTHQAMLALAGRAVELFDEHVRKPIRDTAGSDAAAAAQLVEAFDALLPAVTNLVANHFRRVLLSEAEGRLE
jgi:DNA-binding transcriptional MerR regulator